MNLFYINEFINDNDDDKCIYSVFTFITTL